MQYGKIVTKKREHDWVALVAGTNIWETGKTEIEAIGYLYMRNNKEIHATRRRKSPIRISRIKQKK